MKDRKIKSPSIRFRIPVIATKLPKLWRFRVPLPGGIYMGGGKLVVVSLSAVVLGFLASLFVLISSGDQEITFPMAGAEYDAPSMVGHRVVDREFPAEASQTLKLNLPAGLRVERITFEDIEL
jgi:hypothetical protein